MLPKGTLMKPSQSAENNNPKATPRTILGKKIHITPETKADELESFRLQAPCPECPFRSDLPEHLKGWLGKSRAEEIAHSVFFMGQSFPCHKTTELEEDEEWLDDEPIERGYQYKGCESQCAGASIMQIKLGRESQWMQVARRLNFEAEIKAMDRLDLNSAVFDSIEDFVEFHSR